MEQTKLKDKRKKLIIIVSILVVFIGISFAYIVAQISGSAIGNANITADTADNLDFSIDKDINLNPNQFNVTEGGGGLSDTATGTASLLANSTNKSATFDYYVYFQINTNEYIYTTEDNKPEIVLSITDPEGNPVTKLANSDLEYVEAENADGTTVSGFDITTASGLINIASNYEITSNSSTNATEQDWIFTVTFINLTTNQSENGGSTLDAEIILSKDVTNYHEICEPGTMACDIARLYNEENPESNGLYYHNGTYASENEYCMFEGNQVLSFPNNLPSTSAEDCNTVYSFAGFLYDASVITGGLAEGGVEEVTWDGATCKTTTSGATVYTDMDNNTPVSQESCNGYAAIMGDSFVIMVNVGSGTIGVAIFDAEDYSYRYAGANPNNYVCFGNDEETCPAENLYRIIGVFSGQIKLIKADFTTSDMLGTDGRDYYGAYSSSTSNYKGNMDTSTIAGYSWNWDRSVSFNGSNNWTTSEFNTINLNTNYWNYLGSTWQNLIAETTWHLGAMPPYNNTAKSFYNGERNNAGYGSNPITYSDEIGLMYPSDYGYAARPDAWATDIGDYDSSTITSNNWLYMGLDEWTVTPFSWDSYFVFRVHYNGYLNGNSFAYLGYAARPVFYLKSNVALQGGSGTESDPYRLAV